MAGGAGSGSSRYAAVSWGHPRSGDEVRSTRQGCDATSVHVLHMALQNYGIIAQEGQDPRIVRRCLREFENMLSEGMLHSDLPDSTTPYSYHVELCADALESRERQ